jgi:hypothetical protein
MYQVGQGTTALYKTWGTSQPDNGAGGINSRYTYETCVESRMAAMATSGGNQVGGLNDRNCKDKNYVMCVLDGEWPCCLIGQEMGEDWALEDWSCSASS